MSAQVLVIGGGLSGLTAARALHRAGIGVQLIEARDRLGGRILSVDASGIGSGPFDLGPSWFWPGMQPGFGHFVKAMGVESFPQADAGDLLFQRGPGSVQRYRSCQVGSGPGGHRRVGRRATVPRRLNFQGPRSGRSSLRQRPTGQGRSALRHVRSGTKGAYEWSEHGTRPGRPCRARSPTNRHALCAWDRSSCAQFQSLSAGCRGATENRCSGIAPPNRHCRFWGAKDRAGLRQLPAHRLPSFPRAGIVPIDDLVELERQQPITGADIRQ